MRSIHCCMLLLAGAALVGCGSDRQPASRVESRIDIIPAPADVTQATGQFAFTADTPISFASEGEAAAKFFVDLVKKTRGWSLNTAPDSDSAVVRFELSNDAAFGDEGYKLAITSERVRVTARTARGLLYGGVSLWELLTNDAPIPALTIVDSPRFAWRGVMLDSARHYQSPAFIEKFIDAMATHKLNVLHWHLVDDQAWRLEIRKYPRLTEVGAWRVPAGQAPAADIDAATQRPKLYGGFYTQAEVRKLVAYAAARQITIVPEIEMPGHASAPIAAYPQLGVKGNKVEAIPADWGVYPNLYNLDDATFGFLEDVLTEVMALFPSEYIHVGGDEAVKAQWQASSAIQEKMKALGVADEHRLQSYFIQRIEKFLSSKGRRLIGWDEILEGGLPPNAAVMSWRGIDGAVAAATAGHDTVLSPGPVLYFDNRPYAVPVPGRGRIVSVEDVYRFDPAPAQLSDVQRRHVLGVQANIWTEHIRTEDRVEYMAFPRLAALSEVSWSAPAKIDWTDFSRRLKAQLERYRALGIKYAEPAPAADSATRIGSHDLTLCSESIALSLEDDAPIDAPRAAFLVDIMDPCWILKSVSLAKPLRLKARVGQVPFNFQIGDDINKVVLRKPATSVGELTVRAGCDGDMLATMPLDVAQKNFGVTELDPVVLPARRESHDLCFQFTQPRLNPLWVLDSIEFTAESRSEE